MMTLLYETVHAFTDTWMKCLGDLGRYRIVVGHDDHRDREVWSGVSRYWHKKAADKRPGAGHLSHRLTIQSRPFTFDQLSLYVRALMSLLPFEVSKTSNPTLLNPVANEMHNAVSSFQEVLSVNLVAFASKQSRALDRLGLGLRTLENDLIPFFYQTGNKFYLRLQGIVFALANCSAPKEMGSAQRGHRSGTDMLECQVKRATEAATKIPRSINIAATYIEHGVPPRASLSMGTKVISLSQNSIRFASYITFATFSMVIPTVSGAPINGSPTGPSPASSPHFSVIDYVTVAIGVTILAGSRLLPTCSHVKKVDLSLLLSACEGGAWWAAKSDDRSSPVFLAVYVRPLGHGSWG